MITEIPDLAQIMKHWGLTVLDFKKIKDVFKIKTEYGYKNLKVSPLVPQRLLFVHQAVRHLEKKGFDKMYPLIPALNGESYITDSRYAYTLFDWIEGRQCDFTVLSELSGATRILAEFHQKSTGFKPPEHSNMRNRLDKYLKHFEEHYHDLIIFKETALSMPGDAFADFYLSQVDFFLPMAAQAIAKLKTSCYSDLVTAARDSGCFAHGDPAARNFILTPADTIFIIDFDSCRLDLPVMDLIKFARRVLKKYHWDFETARILMESYNQIKPISATELEVMKAVLYFPQKFWRMAIRYFHNHDRHSPERALHKFNKYVSTRHELARLQLEFDNYGG